MERVDVDRDAGKLTRRQPDGQSGVANSLSNHGTITHFEYNNDWSDHSVGMRLNESDEVGVWYVPIG